MPPFPAPVANHAEKTMTQRDQKMPARKLLAGVGGAALGGLRQNVLKLRVLIADDEADFASSLVTVLERDGHDVRHARTGHEAIAIAEEWHPAFVLLDIYMPGMTGFTAARELRARMPGAAMTLVMMSARDLDESTLVEAGDAGFDRCVDKTAATTAVRALLAEESPAVPGGHRLSAG